MNYKDLGYLAAGVAGLMIVGYAMATVVKMDRISSKIDATIDKISDDIDVQISDAVINKSIKMAVDKEVDYMVEKASNKIIKETQEDMRNEIKKVISSMYSDMKESVSKEMYKQVANISIKDLRDEVVEKAKEDAIKKFDDSLDVILENFNHDLHNVSKIYRSIASSMNGNNNGDKELTFKLS